MYPSVCLSVLSFGHWVSYTETRLITGADDMWRCSRLGIVSLPCPRWKTQHSVTPMARKKKTETIEEEGMSLNAPLTPQNEIDRLAEVIAPSTIFFGRKYCYRQIGDSISCRRWGSRLWSKGCDCPLLWRLQCLLMLYLSPILLLLSLCVQPILFHLPHTPSCFSHILHLTTSSHAIPTQHLSPTSL